MRLYNLIDDKERFVRFQVTAELGEQVNGHIYSYLTTRRLREANGERMGLGEEER